MYRIDNGVFKFNWSFVIRSLAFSVVMISTSYTFLIVAPAIETAWFPVVDILHIEKIEPINAVSSKVWASYRKIRPCEYIGTAWYEIDEDNEHTMHQVGMTLTPKDPDDTSPPTRPVGYIKAGPWRIVMQADRIRDHSLVEVFSRCNPLWITRSHYYP